MNGRMPEGQPLKLAPKNRIPLVCPKCQGCAFIPCHTFYEHSALLNPTGRDVVEGVQGHLFCLNCKAVIPPEALTRKRKKQKK